MKVLFISSGNAPGGINIIVKKQGESLQQAGVEITFFTIKGKGLKAYIKHISMLRSERRKQKYDLFHAHYSLSGMVAALAGCGPLVVSLMGSDVSQNKTVLLLSRLFSSLFWRIVIVKSPLMKTVSGIKKALVLPNGVDLEEVKPMPSETNRSINRKILFAADPSRRSKNYTLAEKAISILNDNKITLKVVHSVPHSDLIREMNNSSLLLLTSLWEGSPNVVKEAMACNLPVVATGVGDIKWLFGDTEGYYITTLEPHDVANKIQQALAIAKPTRGRERITRLGLDSKTIATRILHIYNTIT